MSKLYPLKFEPIFKDKIWGGQKIKTLLKKDFGDLPNCGETWELSGVEGNISTVSNGPLKGRDLKSLIKEYQTGLVGEEVFSRFGEEFPLLIKFIDANQDLSIQVHPDDKLAKERHDGFGKTEMWYVLQADENATLISGFNQEMTREKYLEYFDSGRLMEVLNKETVEAGDVFYLPAGRVHTIGKGLLIAEIQQTSDITYRIYDFDRTDAEGKKRELHTEEALDAIDYTFYKNYKSEVRDLANTKFEIGSGPYFKTNKLVLDESMEMDYSSDTFRILICLDGNASLKGHDFEESISMGEVLLIPAEVDYLKIFPEKEVSFLESTV